MYCKELELCHGVSVSMGRKQECCLLAFAWLSHSTHGAVLRVSIGLGRNPGAGVLVRAACPGSSRCPCRQLLSTAVLQLGESRDLLPPKGQERLCQE